MDSSTMGRRLLLVGDIRRGGPPVNGEQVKNQVLCAWLEGRHRLTCVDTDRWKRRPWVILQVLLEILSGRHDTVLVSASSASVHTLFRALGPFRSARARILYLVIGGYLPLGIRQGRYRVSSYAGLKGIVVEGETMARELRLLGVSAPLHVIPNVKPVIRVHGEPGRYDVKGPTRLLFVGRITEPKGTLAVMEALEHPLLDGFGEDLRVDFYGKLEDGHREAFASALSRHPRCRHLGYLDVTRDPEAAYAIFSEYHALLFPTTWMGEGFPGVILDAYVSGVPVIATDWNMNREVVRNGETGRIIPPCDTAALAEAIRSVVLDRADWARMSRRCHEVALEFDVERVLAARLTPLL